MIVSSTGASLALLNTKKIKDDKQRRVAFRLDGQRPEPGTMETLRMVDLNDGILMGVPL